MEVRVGPAVITAHVDDEVLVSATDGSVSGDSQQGYFVADTRLVSSYRLRLGRQEPILLNSSPVSRRSARFELTNPQLLDNEGREIAEHTLHLRLDRVVGRGVHEDYQVTNYGRLTVDVLLEVSVESDFADIFDVKTGRLQRRGMVQSMWLADRGTLVNEFAHEGFTRGIRLETRTGGASPAYANGSLLFPIRLRPRSSWHACLLWRPVVEGVELPTIEGCGASASMVEAVAETADSQPEAVVTTSDPGVTATIRQAVDDLLALRMASRVTPPFLPTAEAPAEGVGAPASQAVDGKVAGEAIAAGPGTVTAGAGGTADGSEVADLWLPAAGVPWFVTLFGRDALVVSLQALPVSYRFALGSLRALAALQAEGLDDDRDMQPGKIEHELRRGELAKLGLVPHTPYYGTHDATSLFVLAAAAAWRWQGNREEMGRLRPRVEAALAWIDRDGDADGDGIQEYQTRSVRGYFNQGWKDGEDAILHGDGSWPELPIATCELQGLVVAAKRAWARVLEEAFDDSAAAGRLRGEADRLVELVETRFFWADEGTYYLGLDGRKRPIASVASNAGHLLTYRAVDPSRARLVAKRLFEPDVWSGWGIRTLSAAHPSYNPFSYQLGSVWPHDNMLIAAGFRHYGLDAEAHEVAKGMLDAAERLQNRRLPELFAGLDRDEASFPVQYLGANVPQAWASGAVIHLVDVLLGLDPDAFGGRLTVRPSLPRWLGEVSVDGLWVGDRQVSFTVRREGDRHLLVDRSPQPEGLAVVLDEVLPEAAEAAVAGAW